MKRITGPGRVDELLAPPGRDDLVQGALLFNFDFDADAVKPEHRQWLDVNAVPLLRGSKLAKAFLNGTASRAGAADYNRELSRRREEGVKRFLTSKGISPGRLTTTFSGADLSTSRLEDDQRDRAVCVWLQVADAAKPRVIPHTPSYPDILQAPSAHGTPRLHLGFALGAGVIFANAVPSLSNANIEVRPHEVNSFTVINAAGREIFLKKAGTPSSSTSQILASAKLFDPLKPEADQRGRVKIEHDSQDVNVLGLSPGKNDIVLTTPASHFVDILGTVTVLLDVKVFFHFVDGPPGIKTSRTLGAVDPFIRIMNRIYRGQVGIVWASAGANPSLPVPDVQPFTDISGNVGLRVARSGTTDDQKAIIRHRQSEFLFNVFFIGNMIDVSLEMASEDFAGLTTDSGASIGRCCLLRDPQPKDPAGIKWGETLAHEAGHALDEDDIMDEAKKDHLMFWQGSKRTADKIPPLSAFRMLDSAIQFPP